MGAWRSGGGGDSGDSDGHAGGVRAWKGGADDANADMDVDADTPCASLAAVRKGGVDDPDADTDAEMDVDPPSSEGGHLCVMMGVSGYEFFVCGRARFWLLWRRIFR